ncbi:MAG: twin transmembrane helix small protein, partial [Gammaproteobacteria bacterium]|nr:twin transmembrane helix small protein [Gammaproteobacteria bacterium]
MIKTIILLLLLLIIISLAAGMITLIKDRNKTDRTVRFLTLRIALSVSLFVLLAVSFFMGWIQP